MNLNDVRLPSANSATTKGLRTTLWTFIGSCITLSGALWLAINAVPGCSDAVLNFVREHFVEIALAFSLPSGVIGFIGNALNHKTDNY